ncbi:MAG TPA: M3 family metallopeptidase [Myxococcaceae bacterium]|nr:M3 family metallopeptidase [Myxococcaceae bacterium]
MLLTTALILLSATPPPPPTRPGIDWKRTPDQIASTCKSELARARSRVKAALATDDKSSAGPPPLERLIAVETAAADLQEALGPDWMLASVAPPPLRGAAEACMKSLEGFTVELGANPTLYTAALAARKSAESTADRALAQRYVERGRQGGAALDPQARAQLTSLLDQIHQLESEFTHATDEDQLKAAIDLSPEEAASLPPSFAKTLKKSGKSVRVPADPSTRDLVLRNLRPSSARERYVRALYQSGGSANMDRLQRVLALRRQAARLLGYLSWAEYRLETTSVRTPERARPMARQLGTALFPRARAEVATLAALKTAAGEPGPFALWDYAFYESRFEESSFAVDPEAVRQYFPLDVVVPAALGVFEQVLGLRFEPVQLASAWAPGVTGYAVKDAASGALLGWCYLDLEAREGKPLFSASFPIRLGRSLPGGGRVLPVAAIFGSAPRAAPGERALFGHPAVVALFHELGHLAHALLAAAPYASLNGPQGGRADFVEAPSQLFEAWAWDPATLRRVSRHVRTGEPLPEALAQKLAGLRRASAGVTWTRQVFLALYDLQINGPAEVKDPTALWSDLWGKTTPLTTVPGGVPEASLLQEVNGYDGLYFGYTWSRIWAQDMATAFQRGGLTNPEVGLRFRRTVLEPGATAEPEALLRSFLGRPVRTDAFFDWLGLSPPAQPEDR